MGKHHFPTTCIVWALGGAKATEHMGECWYVAAVLRNDPVFELDSDGHGALLIGYAPSRVVLRVGMGRGTSTLSCATDRWTARPSSCALPRSPSSFMTH